MKLFIIKRKKNYDSDPDPSLTLNLFQSVPVMQRHDIDFKNLTHSRFMAFSICFLLKKSSFWALNSWPFMSTGPLW